MRISLGIAFATLAMSASCTAQPAAESVASLAAAAETKSVTLGDEVGAFFGDYLEAFNEGDADKLAKLWAADAVWTSDADGSTTEGSEAIAAELKAVFAEAPGLKIGGQVDRVHPVTDGVVSIEGQVVTSRRDEEPARSSFAAIVVKNENGWQFSSVREFAPPTIDTPYEKLKELEFLVGDWQDDTEAATINTTFRWGAGQSFLVRSYTVESSTGVDDAEALQGTQVIGWDPRAQTVRSWSFDSLGAFGEGTWSRAGDEWVGRLTQTLPDGGAASATQVIRRVDDNTLEVSTVGREVNGEPQPSGDPVRVVRVTKE